MGYSTDFEGKFKLNKKLDEDTYNFLSKLCTTRCMKRNLGPEFGIEGEFFVDGIGFMGQDRDSSVIDANRPPVTQPSLWCRWQPADDGESIEWDGGEKFYCYVEWLQYILKKVLKPKGYILNGEVSWQGEDRSDCGLIIVRDNEISTKQGRIVYE